MPEFVARILSIEPVTPDVKAYRVQKPAGYTFLAGQATEVAVNKPGWTTEKRPFTFTSRGTDAWLEFTIKAYRNRNGVTKLLDTLGVGEELLLHDVWGTLTYRGPGLFLAGGAGITPFLSILRDLWARGAIATNRLVFANKTPDDIIRGAELKTLLGSEFVSVVGDKRIDATLVTGELKRHPEFIYLCGPDPMMEAVSAIVQEAGFGTRLVVED